MAQTVAFFFPQCDNTIRSCAELEALRAANALVIDCHYRVNVPAQGLLGATVAEVHAVRGNELSKECKIDTTFSNDSWMGVFDLANCRYQEVRDNRGNTVRDYTDGSTIGEFPWGNSAFSDNFIEDSTLVGWATQAGDVGGNDIRNSHVDLTGKTNGGSLILDSIVRNTRIVLAAGSGTQIISTSRFVGTSNVLPALNHTGTGALTFNTVELSQNFRITHSGTGGLTITNTKLWGKDPAFDSLVHAGASAMTITNCVFMVATGAPTINNTSTSGNISISSCSFNATQVDINGSGVVTITNCNGINGRIRREATGTGALTLSECVLDLGRVIARGSGPVSLASSRLYSGGLIRTSVASTRGFACNNSTVDFVTIDQNRTGGTDTDLINGTHFVGGGGMDFPITIGGANNPGMAQTIFNWCDIKASQIIISNPAGATLFQTTRISGAALITAPTGVGLVQKCRFSEGCTVDLGAFTHEATIIEGLFNKVLTANNLNRLCNKSFDDTV